MSLLQSLKTTVHQRKMKHMKVIIFEMQKWRRDYWTVCDRFTSQKSIVQLLSHSMIRDQTVTGILDKVRRKLLRETELTLDKAIHICQACLLSLMHLKSFDSESEPAAAMDILHECTKKTAKEKHCKLRQKYSKYCNRYGTNHAPQKRLAHGKECHECGGKNHFARCCLTKKFEL